MLSALVTVQKSILDEMKEAGIDFDYTKVKCNDDLIPFLDYVKENHPELYPCDAFIAGQVEDYKGQGKGWVGIQNYIYAVPDGDGYRTTKPASNCGRQEFSQ